MSEVKRWLVSRVDQDAGLVAVFNKDWPADKVAYLLADKELVQASDYDRDVGELREALLAAVEVIKVWHNCDEVWDIYYRSSPEMAPIRAALEGK